MKGRILGVIPYSFERPNVQAMRDTWWNPENEQIVVPQPFGVGWTLNLASLKRRYPPLFWGLIGVVAWRILGRLRSARAS